MLMLDQHHTESQDFVLTLGPPIRLPGAARSRMAVEPALALLTTIFDRAGQRSTSVVSK